MQSMITKSKEMMVKSFDKTMYNYAEKPAMVISKNYGIYINVPFCYKICSFCPFYKEKYNKLRVDKYVENIVKEIEQSTISGTPQWIYMGGGTPNVLEIEQLRTIINKLKQKIVIKNLGIELHPSTVSKDYIDALKNIGFSKISLGVESFSAEVNKTVQRKQAAAEKVKELISYALGNDFFVNIDMMVGLSKQSKASFIQDIKQLAEIQPSQVTIYPYMVVKGLKNDASMQEEEQFELIEQAWTILQNNHYSRKGPWNFTCVDDLYDSSKDELIDDYIGFGPGSFSTYNGWKIVNPVIDIYNNNFLLGEQKALIAPKTKATDDWRAFARMISDLKLHTSSNFPFGINLYIKILQWTGFGKKGRLTSKGILFAHHITKTIVESLPFPLQNPSKIKNYKDYQAAKKQMNLKKVG